MPQVNLTFDMPVLVVSIHAATPAAMAAHLRRVADQVEAAADYQLEQGAEIREETNAGHVGEYQFFAR